MSSFYVTLPAGVKSVYHENVLSDYITHLPREVRLDGRWEVALVEFHFTKSWFNVHKEMWLGIADTYRRVIERTPKGLTPGKYDIHQLLTKINKLLAQFKRFEGELEDVPQDQYNNLKNQTFSDSIIVSQPALVLDEARNRIMLVPAITSDKNLIFPDMDDELLGMLGLTNRFYKPDYPRYSMVDGKKLYDSQVEYLFKTSVYKNNYKPIKAGCYAERAFDIERGIHAIYVYSDVVEENFIGDVSAQCLRVCTLPAKEFGETVNLHFDQPHYIPVSNRSFQSIRITLKDQSNEKIQFEFGETLVKLHFRKT